MSINGEGTPDISGMIKGIMQNPEFAGLVKELRGDDGKSNSDIQSDIMSKLPEVMSMLGPMMGEGQTGEKKEASGENQKQHKTSGSDTPKLFKNFDKFDKNKASRLMSAIKPYLSHERCEIIDKCMSVIQIGDVMTALRSIEGAGKNDN